MSSILDALNKLEEEQEQLKEQESMRPEDIDSHSAVHDLVGQDVMRDKMTLSVRPVHLIGGGILAFVILVGVVSLVVAKIVQPAEAPIQTANLASNLSIPIESTPLEQPPIETVVPVIDSIKDDTTLPEKTPVTKEPSNIPESATVVATTPPKEVPLVKEPPTQEAKTPKSTTDDAKITTTKADVPSKANSPKASKTFVEKKPEPLPPPTSNVLDKKGPLDFSPTPAPAKATKPVTSVKPPKQDTKKLELLAQNSAPINTYQPFTVGVQLQYGLDKFKLNMVSAKSARNPFGSAVINKIKVFEGDFISGSQVMLYQVEKNGIALEVSRTGKRYYKKY